MTYPILHSSKNGAFLEAEQKSWELIGCQGEKERGLKDEIEVVSLIHFGGKVNINGQVFRKGWFGWL